MNFNYQGIQGFDISTWQDAASIPGHVDFHKMKAWGARFVIIKAGQAAYRDPDFETNWSGAKGILPRASYWYYDNLVHPKVQAGAYRDILEGRMEGIFWLDLEDRTQGSYMGWRHWYDFIQQFKAFLPEAQIGIYTGHFYFEESTMNATDAQREWFKQFPLWLASYTQDPFRPNYTAIRIPRPWTSCLILQSGTPAIGLAAGVESKEIDYNHFNGDEQLFAKYFIGGTQPVPLPTGEPMQYKFTVLTNERTSANATITTNLTGRVYAVGDVVDVVQVVPVSGNQWFKLSNGKYAAYIYNGVTRAVLVDSDPVPAPGLPVFNIEVKVTGEGYKPKVVIVDMEPE